MNHDAAWLNDAALVDATGLVKLKVADNRAITTVAPFGATLRELHVPQCTIGDAGLVTATNLVTLDASMNDKIRSLALCSSSLLELIATCQSVNDAALSTATNLMFLNVSCNERITTIEPCARSLRHLVAGGFNCTLTNQGVSSATQLVTLIREDNPNLTTIKPFQNTLEELTTDIDMPHCEVQTAPNLRDIEGRVLFLWKKAIPHLLQNGFYRPERLPEQRLFRNTVTYEYRQRDRQFRLVPHDYHHRYDEHQNSKESTLATQRCCLVS